MESYTVYVMKVTDKGQFLHSKITLNHLVAPVMEKADKDTFNLITMSIVNLPLDGSPQLTDKGLMRVDLVNLCLVPPAEEVGVVP